MELDAKRDSMLLPKDGTQREVMPKPRRSGGANDSFQSAVHDPWASCVDGDRDDPEPALNACVTLADCTAYVRMALA
jgi:hypothetical protein